MYLDISVVRIVLKSYHQLSAAKRVGDTVDISDPLIPTTNNDQIGEPKLNFRTLTLFVRMILYPIFLMLLVLPGSVVRTIQAGGFNPDATVYRTLSIARNMCDPSFGILNAVMWILTGNLLINHFNRIFAII
jgi:hypothetical protein